MLLERILISSHSMSTNRVNTVLNHMHVNLTAAAGPTTVMRELLFYLKGKVWLKEYDCVKF